MMTESAGRARLIADQLREMIRYQEMGYTERFEAHSELFYAKTGLIAPGKSVPPAMGGYDEAQRDAAWQSFCVDLKADYMALLKAAAEALAGQDEAPRCVSHLNPSMYANRCGLVLGHDGPHRIGVHEWPQETVTSSRVDP